MMKTEDSHGIQEVHPKDLVPHLSKVRLIDVRRPEEFTGELGHIKGSELLTLGPDLLTTLEKGSKDQHIVFICRSGARSGQATMIALDMGYKNAVNLKGGMLLWNESGLPNEK
jgi:hydroxyacylglutathione hydrolase